MSFFSRSEEILRAAHSKDLEETKRKYEELVRKQEEKMKFELEQIEKISAEKKFSHENEKQKVRFAEKNVRFEPEFSSRFSDHQRIRTVHPQNRETIHLENGRIRKTHRIVDQQNSRTIKIDRR